MVLIETLWNVKTRKSCSGNMSSGVLIETLWNVKTFFIADHIDIGLRTNRNIVECKDDYV